MRQCNATHTETCFCLLELKRGDTQPHTPHKQGRAANTASSSALPLLLALALVVSPNLRPASLQTKKTASKNKTKQTTRARKSMTKQKRKQFLCGPPSPSLQNHHALSASITFSPLRSMLSSSSFPALASARSALGENAHARGTPFFSLASRSSASSSRQLLLLLLLRP